MPEDRHRPGPGLVAVRYGLGGVMALAVGGGLSVLLINFLFRLGVSGDHERAREEEARRYFDEHGAWPDEEVREHPSGRRWTLAPGVVTPEEDGGLDRSKARE